jgi:C-terminal processing protease CtpA/Prc
MAKKKRNFIGMSYHEIQRANSINKNKLSKKDRKWLKDNDYKNLGWDRVIALYQKIEELLQQEQFKDLTLEELFLEADRIGNKYLTKEEIAEFNQKLSKEVSEIEKEIDRQFPDTEVEVIDFGNPTNRRYKKNKN